MGAVPSEESQSLFLQHQSESWRPECYQNSINTVHRSYSRDSSMQNKNYIQSGTVPCVSTLCLPDITIHNQISQAFTLLICISKTGGGNSLRMRLQVTRNSSNTVLFCAHLCGLTGLKFSTTHNKVILLKAKTKTTDMGTLCLVDPTQTTVSQLFIV